MLPLVYFYFEETNCGLLLCTKLTVSSSKTVKTTIQFAVYPLNGLNFRAQSEILAESSKF